MSRVRLSRVWGAALAGVDGVAVEVEVRVSSQLPKIEIVGLPSTDVRESAARVRAAIAAEGERFPDRRITINLAPAGLRKSGAGLDLAIAVGILAADGALSREEIEGWGFVGELSLDGRMRSVRGALPLALALGEAGCRRIFVSRDSAAEAALAPGIDTLAAPDLASVLAHLRGALRLEPVAPPRAHATISPLCLAEVRGQEHAKRALVIAASGRHGVLLTGPPGSGKTMLAQRLPTLLPPLSESETLEATRVYSAAGLLDDRGLVVAPPFRAPHHSATPAGLLGGGNPPRPGETSLAHCGVLFLDEIREFDRRCLESLRQVLEQKRVRLARPRYSCVFPANFLLVAAANPCPCGWFRSERRDCGCDEATIARYRSQLSGPLLDRIDLHVEVPALAWQQLDAPHAGESSASLRPRVAAARARQAERGAASNGELADAELARLPVDPAARELLGRAVDGLGLSARAARRVLAVARTVADLVGEGSISAEGVAEALAFRGETRPPP